MRIIAQLIPRFVFYLWAWVKGYSWWPCGICGNGFILSDRSGVWLSDDETWNFIDGPASIVLGTHVCPKCEREAKRRNREGWYYVPGRGKLFSRGEYDALRLALRGMGYEADDALTERGRVAVDRWAVGEFQAREVHVLRSPTPPTDGGKQE